MPEPYPKSRQLRRGEKRYGRIVASPKQWAALGEGAIERLFGVGRP